MKDYINWKEACQLIEFSEKKHNYRIALLIYVSLHTGMRINDVLRLRWCDIMHVSTLCFVELRTSKHRTMFITPDMERFIDAIYNKLDKPLMSEYCFVSQKKSVFTVQRVNQILKMLSSKCDIQDVSLTTNTLRKTFGRELYYRTEGKAISFLSEYFSHPSVQFTMKYLQLESESRTISFCPL